MMVLADCGETLDEGERFAFLAPDNQTGDASLSWSTEVIHRGLAAAVGAGVAADTVAEARLAPGFNRIVYSTLTRTTTPGEVRMHTAIFDQAGHQFNREYTVSGDVLQVINRMATSINPDANALGAKSVDVLRKWPVFTGDMANFEGKCLALVEAEPGFGAALGSCAEQLVNSGRLESVRALLHRIPAERSEEFSPDVQFVFGQSLMALKEYAKAADVYRSVVSTRPVVKNLLGYAEALAGRCDAGKQAIEEYGRQPGQEPNALDSLGEISYFCGQYKDAEKYFLASEAKYLSDPRGVMEPVKAAASRMMTGDAAGADKIATSYFQKIAKSNPQAVATLQPVWTTIMKAPIEDRRKLVESSLIRRP